MQRVHIERLLWLMPCFTLTTRDSWSYDIQMKRYVILIVNPLNPWKTSAAPGFPMPRRRRETQRCAGAAPCALQAWPEYDTSKGDTLMVRGHTPYMSASSLIVHPNRPRWDNTMHGVKIVSQRHPRIWICALRFESNHHNHISWWFKSKFNV